MSEATIDSFWKAQTKTAKLNYFTKNLSSPTFFETTTSKFQEVFLDIFRNFCRIEFSKNSKTFFFNKK